MRSKVLSHYPRLRELYLLYLEDPDIREHLNDLALLNARIDSLLEVGVGVKAYENIKRALGEYEQVRREHPYDGRKQDEALAALHDAVEDGNKEAAMWGEVYGLMERAGRARERQDRREASQRMVVPLADVYLFLGELVGVLHRNISDPDLLRRLQADLDRLLLTPQTVH